MKAQSQIVAVLNIAAGAFYLLIAIAVLIFMSMAGVIVVSQGAPEVAGLIGIVGTAVVAFMAVLGLPSVIGGWALLAGKSWAKPLLLVLAVLHLPNMPFGTALGIYTLVALLSEEPATARPALPTAA
jgi:hypothetical protein